MNLLFPSPFGDIQRQNLAMITLKMTTKNKSSNCLRIEGIEEISNDKENDVLIRN